MTNHSPTPIIILSPLEAAVTTVTEAHGGRVEEWFYLSKQKQKWLS